MKMIHVAPAEGMRILNPFDGFAELRPGLVPDAPFWRRRAKEGGVVITEQPASIEAPAPKLAPAKK